MHDDFRLNWTLPAVSPGPAIKQEKPLTKDERESYGRLAFVLDDNAEYKQDNGLVVVITEEDCRQIKGAAQPVREVQTPAADASQAVAAPPKGKWVPGMRVRVVNYLKPGSHPYGDGDEGVCVRIVGTEVVCRMDRYNQGTDRPHECFWPIETPCLEPIDSWVEHDGRGRPSAVNALTRICIKWRDGMTVDGVSADGWTGWFHGEQGPERDIVAYRILP